MTLVFVRTFAACVCVVCRGEQIACDMEGRDGGSHLWHEGEGVTMQIVHVVHRRRVGGVNFLWHRSGDIQTGNNQKNVFLLGPALSLFCDLQLFSRKGYFPNF